MIENEEHRKKLSKEGQAFSTNSLVQQSKIDQLEKILLENNLR